MFHVSALLNRKGYTKAVEIPRADRDIEMWGWGTRHVIYKENRGQNEITWFARTEKFQNRKGLLN